MDDYKMFSWSKSRARLFDECKRGYYFNYYGYWDAWMENASERAREIYVLKKIVSKEIWIGSVVHDIIKKVLSGAKSGNEIQLSYALNLLKKRLDTDYNNSMSGLYKSQKVVGLFEHEYDLLIPKDEWDELFKIAENCIINFYNSDVYRNIKKVPISNWIFLEDFLNFNFEGTKIFLRIDFVIKDGNKVILYDWKTGRERSEEDENIKTQLASYALFVLDKWKIQPESITAKIYNLRIDKEDEFAINNEIIEKVKNYIRENIKSMKELLTDEKNNLPKDEQEFSKTDISRYCTRCGFKKLCFNTNVKGGNQK